MQLILKNTYQVLMVSKGFIMDDATRLELTYINDALAGLTKMIFLSEYTQDIDVGEVACLVLACQEKLKSLISRHDI